MKRILTGLFLTTLPFAAHAETQLERFERIAETMNDHMFEAMIRMVEQEGGNAEPLRATIPDGTWNDAYRDAGGCMLDKLRDASSNSAVDQMLSDMEAALPMMATMDIETMGDEMDFAPEGISDEFMIAVNSECGFTELSMQRMNESGFTAAMMQSMRDN